MHLKAKPGPSQTKQGSGLTALTLHWARLKGAAPFPKTKSSLTSTVAMLVIQELQRPVLKLHFHLETPLRAKSLSVSAQTSQVVFSCSFPAAELGCLLGHSLRAGLDLPAPRQNKAPQPTKKKKNCQRG